MAERLDALVAKTAAGNIVTVLRRLAADHFVAMLRSIQQASTTAEMAITSKLKFMLGLQRIWEKEKNWAIECVDNISEKYIGGETQTAESSRSGRSGNEQDKAIFRHAVVDTRQDEAIFRRAVVDTRHALSGLTMPQYAFLGQAVSRQLERQEVEIYRIETPLNMELLDDDEDHSSLGNNSHNTDE